MQPQKESVVHQQFFVVDSAVMASTSFRRIATDCAEVSSFSCITLLGIQAFCEDVG